MGIIIDLYLIFLEEITRLEFLGRTRKKRRRKEAGYYGRYMGTHN